MTAARPILSRVTVRLYDQDDVEAWHMLRLQLSRRLGRMPSFSEVAAVIGRALDGDVQAVDRTAKLLRRSS